MTNMPRTIEFTEGDLAGELAAVTYDDGEYMRVTPLDGDPLASIEVRKDAGNYRESHDL